MHRAETERLGLTFLEFVQDHWGAETLQLRQYLLSFLIKLDVAIFERMVDDLTGLVMLDADRGLGTGTVAAPFDMSGDDVFWALQPLETNDGDRRRLDLAVLDAAMGKCVDLVSRHGRLFLFHARLHCDADPWVRNVLRKFVWEEATDHTPGFAAEHDQLFARPQALTVFALDELVVELVSGAWRDRFDKAVTDAIPFPGECVADLIHRPFIIIARTHRDLIEIGPADLVLSEQPINRAVLRYIGRADRKPLALRVPFIELAVQYTCALRHHAEVGAKRLVLDWAL
ncbi:hypothetical protein [Bradyrhizobium algeriense]|uniref:hypothetical protein n=1 Tax=Bradyrhizobium algeriense TaxID=634784 RepID=UPI002FEFFE98